jgi:para-aminobenzoate synthetase component 1
MHLFVINYPSKLAMADAFISLYSKSPYAFFLDREHSQTERFSVIGASSGLVTSLKESCSHFKSEDVELPFSFRPGLVGALSYEGVERFMLVDRAIVFDHARSTVYFLGLFEEETDFQSWEQSALLRLALIGGEGARYRKTNPVNSSDVSVADYLHSDAEYFSLIESAKDYIAKGDAYQVCLTNQISIETDLEPFAVYLKLREANPSPFSSFMRLADVSIVSSSPEQFLNVSPGGVITTKPIKGTRPRDADSTVDAQLAAELLNNVKEQAENLMIVDLMRNDLGRVSLAEDVVVTKLFDVESYSTVHQLVSTVSAKLKPEHDVLDAIEACFPAGSMTGAPKIRAMQILSELEDAPRGLYSGCFGFIGFNGAADLAMTIRTIVFEDGKATIGIGGGITIDSDPKAELLETKLKAKALLAALGVET